MESVRNFHLSSVSTQIPLEYVYNLNRFISPAIASPDNIDVEIPQDDGGVTRRGLRQVARVVRG